MRWALLILGCTVLVASCSSGGLDYPEGTTDGTQKYFDGLLELVEQTEPAISSENAQECVQRVVNRLVDEHGEIALDRPVYKDGEITYALAHHDKASAVSILDRCFQETRFR